MKLWGCIQLDKGSFMGYFSTSGRNLKTGSRLLCYETYYMSVSNFTVSHQKVILSRLGYLPIYVKPETQEVQSIFVYFCHFWVENFPECCTKGTRPVTRGKYKLLKKCCTLGASGVSYDFKFYSWFTGVKIFEFRPRKFFKSIFFQNAWTESKFRLQIRIEHKISRRMVRIITARVGPTFESKVLIQ